MLCGLGEGSGVVGMVLVLSPCIFLPSLPIPPFFLFSLPLLFSSSPALPFPLLFLEGADLCLLFTLRSTLLYRFCISVGA